MLGRGASPNDTRDIRGAAADAPANETRDWRRLAMDAASPPLLRKMLERTWVISGWPSAPMVGTAMRDWRGTREPPAPAPAKLPSVAYVELVRPKYELALVCLSPGLPTAMLRREPTPLARPAGGMPAPDLQSCESVDIRRSTCSDQRLRFSASRARAKRTYTPMATAMASRGTRIAAAMDPAGRVCLVDVDPGSETTWKVGWVEPPKPVVVTTAPPVVIVLTLAALELLMLAATEASRLTVKTGPDGEVVRKRGVPLSTMRTWSWTLAVPFHHDGWRVAW